MHPPEPAYPCYLPVLGEFNRMTPHEGPSASLPDDWVCLELVRFRPSSPAGHAHFSRPRLGATGQGGLCWGTMSSPRAGCRACPLFGVGRVGHAHPLPAGLGILGYVHPWRAAGHVRGGRPRGTCPFFAPRGEEQGAAAGGVCQSANAAGAPCSGLAAWGMPIFRGRAGHWDYVQTLSGPRGMSCGGRGQRGACPFLAGRAGLFGPMSRLRADRGACPVEKARAGAGRAQLGEAGKFRYSSICF